MLFASLLLILLGITLAGIVLVEAYRGTGDLLSLRNLFFLSFGVFQINSGLFALINNDFFDYRLNDPDQTSIEFAMLGWVFMGILVLAYKSGFVVKGLARRLPGENAAPSTMSMFVLAAVLLVVGVLFKQVLIYVPIFGPLSDKIGSGLIPLAAGLAAWAWAPRLLNPVVAAYAGGIILVAMFMSILGSFGRRDLVSVLAVCGWAWYHSWWKHGGVLFAMKRLAVAGTLGVVLLAGWSTVRGKTMGSADPVAVLKSLAGSKVGEGAYAIAHGQYAGVISMWLIEHRPETRPYDTLHSVKYYSTLPIPRVFYPDKPEGLGIKIPGEANLKGRAEGFSVGPGIIGHVVNDNPWIALWLYPIVFGLAFRFADEAIRSRPYSPFIALPFATGLGELVGLARGELALFAFNATVAIVSSYCTMIVVRQLLAWFGWRPSFGDEDQDWFDEHNPLDHHAEYIEYDDYGYDENDSAA